MKTWKTWVAWLASAGLCLGLAACHSSTAEEPPPPGSKPDAAKGAPGVGAVPPQEAPPAGPPAAGDGDGDEELIAVIQAAAANRGNRKQFTDPKTAATAFLFALKEKNLNRMAQATALYGATKASESKNQELFRLILAQKLGMEDLDELAEKLSGFKIAGTNAPALKITKIVITKPAGNGVMTRTVTMRQEKAGWKVQDISGEGELAEPIIKPRKGRSDNRQ